MAIQVCAYCGQNFRWDKVGRPAKYCPAHRDAANRVTKADPSRKMDIYDQPFIQNRKPGDCYVCQTYVPVGSGWAHRVNGTWVVKCQNHKPQERAGGTPTPTPATQAGQGDPIVSQVSTFSPGAVEALLEAILPKVLDEVQVPQVDEELIAKMIQEKVPEVLASMGRVQVDLTIDQVKVDLPKTHHSLLPTLIQYLSLGSHVFMPGPAGSGKSTLAMQAAKALNLHFGSISFGPTTPTSKLFGYMDANGNYIGTEFRKCYECHCADETYTPETCECGGIFLGDELDNGHPGLLAELNQALANPYCAFADRMVRRGSKFRFIATGNTFGRGPSRQFQGRNVLDAATLDRFWTLEVQIDEIMERTLAMGYARPTDKGVVARWVTFVQGVRAKAQELNLLIIVSPRSTIEGAKALAAGVPWDQVVNDRLVPGIDVATRKQLGIHLEGAPKDQVQE